MTRSIQPTFSPKYDYYSIVEISLNQMVKIIYIAKNRFQSEKKYFPNPLSENGILNEHITHASSALSDIDLYYQLFERIYYKYCIPNDKSIKDDFPLLKLTKDEFSIIKEDLSKLGEALTSFERHICLFRLEKAKIIKGLRAHLG